MNEWDDVANALASIPDFLIGAFRRDRILTTGALPQSGQVARLFRQLIIWAWADYSAEGLAAARYSQPLDDELNIVTAQRYPNKTT